MRRLDYHTKKLRNPYFDDKRKQHNRRTPFVVVLSLGAVVAAAYWVGGSSFFQIRDVQVHERRGEWRSIHKPSS